MKTCKLIDDIARLHIKSGGFEYTNQKLNMNFKNAKDLVDWCKKIILDSDTVIERTGNYWYVTGKGYKITVTSSNYTIMGIHRSYGIKESEAKPMSLSNKEPITGLDRRKFPGKKYIEWYLGRIEKKANGSYQCVMLADKHLSHKIFPVSDKMPSCEEGLAIVGLMHDDDGSLSVFGSMLAHNYLDTWQVVMKCAQGDISDAVLYKVKTPAKVTKIFIEIEDSFYACYDSSIGLALVEVDKTLLDKFDYKSGSCEEWYLAWEHRIPLEEAKKLSDREKRRITNYFQKLNDQALRDTPGFYGWEICRVKVPPEYYRKASFAKFRASKPEDADAKQRRKILDGIRTIIVSSESNVEVKYTLTDLKHIQKLINGYVECLFDTDIGIVFVFRDQRGLQAEDRTGTIQRGRYRGRELRGTVLILGLQGNSLSFDDVPDRIVANLSNYFC